MMVHLGIQHPLRQPLLQFVDQAAALEHRCRVATGQKLIHHLIRDSLILVRRHTLPPALPGVIVWLEHEISDTLESFSPRSKWNGSIRPSGAPNMKRAARSSNISRSFTIVADDTRLSAICLLPSSRRPL